MSDTKPAPLAADSPPAEAAPAAAAAPARQGRASLPGLLLLSLALIAVIRGGFLLVLIGLMPSFAAYIADRTANKSTFRCVFFCNFAGLLPYLMAARYASLADAMTMMRDQVMWLVILSGAAIGWGIVWLTPLLVRIWLRFYYAQSAVTLAAANKKLAENWGLEKNV